MLSCIRALISLITFMELTYFLAQFIGLYLLLVGLLMVLRKKLFLQIIHEFYESSVPLFLAGWIAMFLGLFLVLNYNYWSSGILELVITILGWVALVKGIALVFIPKTTARWVRSVNLEKLFYLYAIIVLVIGAYLAHAGFTHMGLLH